MAGRGPAPSPNRRRRNQPVRGEWKPAPGSGWQGATFPDPPELATEAARNAWNAWFTAWFAANWGTEDLPGLIVTIQLYDQVQAYMAEPYTERETRKGDVIHVLKPNPASELRQMMDNYGITPKGQQDRRWVKPADAEPAPSSADQTTAEPYGGLRVVAG